MGKQLQVGDSVYIPVVHETYTLSTNTWAEADPDAGYPKITITDPDGTVKVEATGMTKKATGKFEYEYTIPAGGQGEWTGYVDVLNSTKPNRQYFTFRVED
ncbi:MAG: hypothetical protein M0R06_22770 [Sphaerochaeta sp.]|jgi:hypothetical protein|nr:hypothetical protein [Sphaerochaeta sp.]